MSKPSRISISEEELKKIQQMEIYLVVEHELQKERENKKIKDARANPGQYEETISGLLTWRPDPKRRVIQEKHLFETGTIDDGYGMFWMDIIALLLSSNCGLLSTRSDEVHKKLYEHEILQWFQTLRSSLCFLNSTIQYNARIQQRDEADVVVRKQNEDLKSSNKELESKNEELKAVAQEAITWARLRNIEEVNFSSNFKI